MLSRNFWQVDAFTDKAFKGNPAAVFIIEERIEDSLMQNIAAEMNLLETAFVLLSKNNNPLLRWFTPIKEVDLCGHSTLAAAHIYMTEQYPPLSEVTFNTKVAGSLKVIKRDNQSIMDFPLRPGSKINIDDFA